MIQCEVCGTRVQEMRTGRKRFCSRACKARSRVISGERARSSRKWQLKHKYGLTLEQVSEMEKGGCAICGTTDWMGRHNRPHVDHDHRTGKIRGLLCHNCNTAIGLMEDDPVLIKRAYNYLRSSLVNTP